MSDLADVEAIAGALLRSIAPAERRSLLRRMATDLRRSQQQRITAQQDPDGQPFVPRRPKPPVEPRLRRRGRIRRRAMFAKLRLSKHLQAGATDQEAWVGFAGRVARIARIHQEGREDRPGPGQTAIRYPKRVLIGLTPAEAERMLDLLLAQVTD